jgi:3-hydroxyisobutyrate dehydrogenase-like beta-hydroxyacid dehydrogenase
MQTTTVKESGVKSPTVIGVIGLGNMGSRFAANLLKEGFKIIAFDIKKDNVERISSQKLGALTVANSNAEVARLSDVIFTILPTSESALSAILDEASGVAKGLRAGKTFVEMSSIDSKTMESISSALRAKTDCDIIDATISGVEEDVENRRIVVMVAGKANVIQERVRPVLERVTKGVVYVDDRIGAAKDLKTSTAMISAIQMTGVSEVLAWLAKRNVSTHALLELMEKTSTNLHNMTEVTKRLLDGNFKERASWMPKDVGFGLKEAEDSGVPMPITAAVQQVFMLAKSNNLSGYEAPGIVRKAYELISHVQISENE